MPDQALSALKKASSIGPAKVGDRYVPTEASPSLWDLVKRYTVGEGRPASVAAQDPYGVDAWSKGAGGTPPLMMGSTEEAKGPMSLVAREASGAIEGMKGLYSRVSRVAQELPESLHPSKALSLFKNGTASEEMDYRGLTEFLKGQQGNKVAKGDILSHLESNPAPFPKEVVKGE